MALNGQQQGRLAEIVSIRSCAGMLRLP